MRSTIQSSPILIMKRLGRSDCKPTPLHTARRLPVFGVAVRAADLLLIGTADIDHGVVGASALAVQR